MKCTGTALDESNVRKTLNRILDAAGLDRRGPHQMRHTFASLLVQDGVPITYVAAQLGHRDSSITLRVYSHWLPDASRAGLVDRLDETTEDGPQTAPRAFDEHDQKSVSALKSMVSRGNRTPIPRGIVAAFGPSVRIIEVKCAIGCTESNRRPLQSSGDKVAA